MAKYEESSSMDSCGTDFFDPGAYPFCRAAEILRRKTAAETDMVHSFYEIEENSLDVLFLGSSHLYYGVQRENCGANMESPLM